MVASLVVNGQLEPNVLPRPSDQLRCSPLGPYTVTVVERRRIEAQQQHVQRLATAIDALCSLCREGSSLADPQYAGLETRLAAECGQRSLHAYIEELVMPSISLAIANNEAQPDSNAAALDVLTILLYPNSPDKSSALSVLVHTFQMQRPSVATGVSVQLIGTQRVLPALKRSQWIIDRQPFEAELDEGMAEGVMATSDGRLLEGFISNVFVVMSDEDGSQHVETASVAEDGVLGGIMRDFVLVACQRIGVRCIENPPNFHGRGRWTEMILTSSVKRLQPVASITCNSPHFEAGLLSVFTLPYVPGPVTRRLQAEVAALVDASSVALRCREIFRR